MVGIIIFIYLKSLALLYGNESTLYISSESTTKCSSYVLSDHLDEMIDLLNPGGRICIITFHSLEDRIVKSNFKRNENPCTCPSDFPVCVCGKVSKGKVITRKPILPSEKELEENSRSKSAKLRVFERR